MTLVPSHTRVTASGARPSRWLLLLHGILGRGVNWRAIARRAVDARPDWGAALVDLRLHGRSLGHPPPHTVEAAAADLDALDGVLDAPIAGVVGHSFGGKVALAYVARRAPSVAVIVDASPGTRPSSLEAFSIIDFLIALGPHVDSREAFVDVAAQRGIGRTVAEWLAAGLERDPAGGMRFPYDFRATRALVEDYIARDLWPVVESPPAPTHLHLVVGDRSDTWSPADRDRARRIADASHGRVALHVLDAGHWVHTDDADGMTRILVEALA